MMSEASSYTGSTTEHEVKGKQLLPGLTNGPARFIITNDGSQDCLAFFPTEMFLTKLNEMFEQDRDLDTIEGPVIHAKMEIKGIERSMQAAKDSLQSVESETEIEEIRHYLNHQERRLINLCQRRDELEEQCTVLKREIDIAGNYAHYVLKTAMESAGLLRQRKPLPLPDINRGEPILFPTHHPAVSESRPRPAPSPEKIQRQVAYDELKDCWYHLQKVQRLFDEREYVYQEELADYRERCIEGRCSFPQSELDRHHVRYGMEVTGALIEAESAFEKAKDRADVLGVGSSRSDSSLDHRYDESLSAEQIQVSASMVNRSFIEAWRADIPAFEDHQDIDMTATEGLDTGLVDISDSMSARDCGEYRKRIDRWQETRGVYEGCNRRSTRTIWTNDEERRHSA